MEAVFAELCAVVEFYLVETKFIIFFTFWELVKQETQYIAV